MVSAPKPTSSTCTIANANLQVFKNAGHFGSLSFDLVQYLFSSCLARTSDQLALGRTCRWLHAVVQQTQAWQLLFHPSSILASFTRPVLGPYSSQFSLPAPLNFDAGDPIYQVVCWSVGRISRTLGWVAKEQHHGVAIDSLVYADQLVLRSTQVPPLPQDPAAVASNAESGYANPLQVYLPLFVNVGHFDAGFPLLQDQVARILDPLLPKPGTMRHPIPRLVVTEFFPQLVRNTAARLAISANAPTVYDVEALVQVHMVWRASIHRFALGAPSWITSKLHQLVNQLNRGGNHARQVPLMELVSLLHVSTDKDLTWARIGQRIVEENMIRLFEYVRGCGGCTAKLKDPGMDKIGESTLRLANKIWELQADGYGFVPWQMLLFQAQFLRGTSSILTMGPLVSFARNVGQFKDNQHLVPGPPVSFTLSSIATFARRSLACVPRGRASGADSVQFPCNLPH